MMAFPISLFQNKRDNEPQPALINWADLCQMIKSPEVREEKDGKLFAPARFIGTRAKANVAEVSMLVLDYDGGAAINDEWNHWRESGYQAALYTTHSHRRALGSEPKDKFRIVLPLLTPISAEEFPRLWLWANQQSNQAIDQTAKDASRIFYTPAKASPDSPYEYRFADGEMLDWTLLDLPEIETRTAKPATAPSNPTAAPAYARKAFDEELSLVLRAGDGFKNDQLNKSGFALGQLIGAGVLDEAEVENALFRAVVAAGAEDKNHAARTLRDAIRDGKAQPRQLPSPQPLRPITFQVSNAPALPQQPDEPQESDYFSQYISDIADDVEDLITFRHQAKIRCDVSTGWESLDEHYRPVKPAFTIITGQPNHGKSNWLDNLMTNLCRGEGWKFAIISFETQPIELHKLFIISFMAGEAYSLMDDQEIRAWANKLKGQFIFHKIPSEMRTIAGTLAFLRYTCERHQIDGVAFDPFTELSFNAARGELQGTVIGNGLTALKDFAYTSKVHFWLVIHPTKSPNETRGKGRILTLEDGSGSKNFENKADYGITVHRHNPGEHDDQTEIFITKIRRGFPGKRGSVKFDYTPPVGNYEEANSMGVPQNRGRNRY